MSIASPDTHDDKPGAKIILRSDLGESVAVETPWAFELGDGHYRLDNVPWWAAEYSLDDVVRCEEDEDEQPLAVEVAEPSGHRTARVLFSPLSRPEVQAEVLADLDRAGAGYEGTGRDRHGFYAVDVPPGVEVAGALEGEALEWQLPGESAFLARCYRAYTTDNFTVAHEGGELMVDIENGRWERLAAEPAGEGRWRVASIPLFAYHVFPGDVVEASARPGE